MLQLNSKLRYLSRQVIFGGPDDEILEELRDLFRELYEEIGRPDRLKILEESLEVDLRVGLKYALSNLTEDIAEFLYREIMKLSP
ncbi:MAG: hypothetical protein LM591_05205 [Candidatus Korarchaeum sp.]|nr:hypothetical protein [Candidatus Korarchaeum sp.]